MQSNIFIIGLLFIFLFNHSLAQKHEFYGALLLNGEKEQSITYKIVFDIDTSGKITGYSISDFGGPHETKNIIVGHYDKIHSNLSFFEKDIVYTKSEFSESDFCYVNFSGTVKPFKTKSKIDGKFNGWFKNKEKCIDGKIKLIGASFVEKLISTAEKVLKKSNKINKEEKQKYNVRTIFDSLNTQQLITKENLNVFTNKEKIYFTLWDLGEEDGDIINLYHNGKIILENFEVKKEKRTIETTILGEDNIFTIKALNVGKLKPNTAMVVIHDGQKSINFLSNLEKDEQSTITIRRNP